MKDFIGAVCGTATWLIIGLGLMPWIILGLKKYMDWVERKINERLDK